MITDHADPSQHAKALSARLSMVLADGTTMRWETNHPSAVTVQVDEYPSMSASDYAHPSVSPHRAVTLTLDTAAPYLYEYPHLHPAHPSIVDPEAGYAEWLAPLPHGEDDTVDPRAAYLAGFARAMLNITDPPHVGRYQFTLRGTQDGSHGTQETDATQLAQSLVRIAANPQALKPGDRLMVERVDGVSDPGRQRIAKAVSGVETIAGTILAILEDIGVNPEADGVKQAVLTRLMQLADTAADKS